jgi:hypothetical protein
VLKKLSAFARRLLLAAVFLSCGNLRTKTAKEVSTRQTVLPLLPPGYATWKTFALIERRDGIDGRLELLIDSRIQNRENPVGEGLPSCNPCVPVDESPAATYCTSLTAEPLRSAQFRLVSRTGEPIASRELECPLAQVTKTQLRPNFGPAYVVTVDLSSVFGDYTGPVTKIAEVAQGNLQWVTATDSITGKTRELKLTSSGTEAWALAPRDGGGMDILVAAAGSSLDAHSPVKMQYTLELIRYSLEGNHWGRHSRTEQGFWESDRDFPERVRFP